LLRIIGGRPLLGEKEKSPFFSRKRKEILRLPRTQGGERKFSTTPVGGKKGTELGTEVEKKR